MRHGKLSAAAHAFTLCVLGVVMSAGWSAAATLTGMTVSTEGEVTRIHVMLDEPVEHSMFVLQDPPRLFVDVRGVDAVVPKSLPGGQGMATSIEASVWSGDGTHAMTRITVNLATVADADIQSVEDGLDILLQPQGGKGWSPETVTLETVPESLPEPRTSGVTGTEEYTADTTPETETSTFDYDFGNATETDPMTTPTTPMTTSTTAGETEMTPAEDALDYVLPTEPVSTGRDERRATVASFGQSERSGLSGRGGPRVSLDIQGADIYAVLRSISEYSGVNIVMGYDVPTKLKEPLSFHLENVPWGEALEMVLRSAHLWYSEEGNIIRVDTEENLRNEDLARTNAARQLEDVMPLTTKIVEVIYAHAAELKPTVEKSLTRRGVIEVDERTNSMVVTDIRPRVESAVEMVKHLDSQTPQIEIVAKLVDVDARYTRELGVLWTGDNSGSNGEVSIGPASLGANDLLDPSLNVKLGLVKSWGTVNALISAMEQDNKANIISNPRVTTVNNRQARILVGKKIPLIVLDEAGNAVTELVTIGIALRVTPHINDNNRITLDLHPEVSDLSSQATVQGGVIINTSESDTRVMVGNGETAVIGGLIRSNETTLIRGVPILKDVPLLGNFFRKSSKVNEKRELLIFVTPRILNAIESE